MQVPLAALTEPLRATLVGSDATIERVITDSRLARPGDLFVPLVAERDGHDFIGAALAAGATAALSERSADNLGLGLAARLLLVAHTGAALNDLAGFARARMSGSVIGVTGSVGKTTVKDLMAGVLATKLDRSGGQVSSRLGVAAEALEVTPGMDLGAVLGPDAEGSAARAVRRQAGGPVTYVVADEAQFYDETQVEQLAHLVDDHGVDVYAFGLLTSFQGRLFPATARWLELADERSELQVEARCWCGARATHNARLIDGRQIYEGDLLVVGDTPPSGPDAQTSMELDEHRVTYELLCRSHWVQGRTGPDPETHHLVRNERIDS